MKHFPAGSLALFSLGLAVAQKDQAPPRFNSGIDLVTSAVVVHDAQGRAVGNLRSEDFAIFDKGKPQKITVFSVEHMAAPASQMAVTTSRATSGSVEPAPAESDRPAVARYVLYVFDDLHLHGETFIRVIQAARKHMGELRPDDHAAIVTTSGGGMPSFSTRLDDLQQALARISPGPAEPMNCPDLSFFEADLILNKHDYDATMNAIYEAAAECGGIKVRTVNPNAPPDLSSNSTTDPALSLIKGVAQSVYHAGEQRTGNNFEMLDEMVGALSGAPGQRILVLASPGFLAPDDTLEMDALMDRAARNQVVINALDARGLSVNSGQEASKHLASGPRGFMPNYPYAAKKGEVARREATALTNVLAELAYGTGGTLFWNNNDLVEGFRQVAGAPEYMYLIGFTPEKLKLDGNFHALKVELKNQPGLKIESARKGYYAVRPK